MLPARESNLRKARGAKVEATKEMAMTYRGRSMSTRESADLNDEKQAQGRRKQASARIQEEYGRQGKNGIGSGIRQ